MSEVFVGRQPIFDRDTRILAYELLFRRGAGGAADFHDGDAATSEVVRSTLVDLGLERVVGSKLAFINLTRSLLVSGAALVLPRERVVLELLEDMEIDEPVLEAVAMLRGRGYRIALDDYIFQESHNRLLKLVHYVKIDLHRLELDQVREQVRRLRAYGVKLLAEKIETPEQYEACREMGFDYFQGWHLCRPVVVQGRKIPTSKVAVLQLLRQLHDPATGLADLERCVVADASLSYQLLRFINSAHYGLAQPVESVHRALVRLGLNAVRQWVTLIALRALEAEGSDAVLTALIRAHLCQRLAERAQLPDSDVFFTVGLLSTLDVVLRIPMEDILAELPISASVKSALQDGEGVLGEALQVALAFEGAREREGREFHGLSEERVGELYLEAVTFAYETKREIGR